MKVTIDSPCIDCGGNITVDMLNGKITGSDPSGIYGYVDVPFRKWADDWPYT